MTMTDSNDMKAALLDAALPHVPFTGWSEATFRAAIQASGQAPAVARALYPRGAVDLALAYHERGDAEMASRLQAAPLPDRFRDRIAAAIRHRLEAVSDKEAVRRGMTLFALPNHAADGARAIWGTADRIWISLGDRSDDVNWYTKRMTLSGVYAATVLYWLGDTSQGHGATWAFLDRRIEDVMQVETLKAQLRDNKALSAILAGPAWLIGQIKAPIRPQNMDFPGTWTRPE